MFFTPVGNNLCPRSWEHVIQLGLLACLELLKLAMIINCDCQFVRIWNHPGDTLQDVSVGVFHRETSLKGKDPLGMSVASSFQGTEFSIKRRKPASTGIHLFTTSDVTSCLTPLTPGLHHCDRLHSQAFPSFLPYVDFARCFVTAKRKSLSAVCGTQPLGLFLRLDSANPAVTFR